MTRVRFFTDEDVHGQVAVQLRAMGFDALSTPEAGRLGLRRAFWPWLVALALLLTLVEWITYNRRVTV